MADTTGTSGNATPIPAASGANDAPPLAGNPAASAAPLAETPAQTTSLPNPTDQAQRAGTTEYRQRTLRTIEALGLPLVKGQKSNSPSVRLSLEAAANRIKALEAEKADTAGLTEAERARIQVLEAQIEEWKAKATVAETDKERFIRRQEVVSLLSPFVAAGAIDVAANQMLSDYEQLSDGRGTFWQYEGRALINGTTGQFMDGREVAAHMLARYPFMAKAGAPPGVTPVGQVQTGDLQAQLANVTDPQARFELAKQIKAGLKK